MTCQIKKILILTYSVFFCLLALTTVCNAADIELHSQQELSDVVGPFTASRYLIYKKSDEKYHYFQETGKFGPMGPSKKYKIARNILYVNLGEANRVITYNQNLGQFEIGRNPNKKIIKANFKEKYTYEEESFLNLKAQYEKLPSSTSNEDRSYKLMYLMEATYKANHLKEAKIYAQELLKLAISADAIPNNFAAGTFMHKANMALGKIAFDSGDIESAKSYLIASVKMNNNSSLKGFGPNMSLAKKLLDRGEKQAVIEYLTLCESFWKKDILEGWKKEIAENKVPNFGGNMYY